MKSKAICFVVAALVGSVAQANVVGVDTQNFNPTNDGLDFVTVHSSETLNPGIINFGLFLNYAVNSLPNYEDTTTASRTNFQDALLSADLNFAVGLTKNWEAGMSFPMLISQSVESDAAATQGQFAQTGLTEIRAMTKYRIMGDASHGIAVIPSINFSRIEDNPFTGNKPGPTVNLELAADTTYQRYALGANVGYRFRNPGEAIPGIPVSPMGDQFIASGAVSYLFRDIDTKVIAEIFSSFPMEDTEFISDREISSAEFLLGAKYDVTPQAALHVGGGTEIFQGTASPDWRIYGGINWTMGPLFASNDDRIVKVEKKIDDEAIRREIEELDAFAADVPQKEETFVGRGVLFEFNSDELAAEAKESLQKLAAYLKRPPGMKSLEIEGHTDSVGAAAYNLNLSQRRASRVRQALVELGISASRVKAIGYGETQPIADNGNYQGRAANRRVEFIVQR